MRKQAAHVSDNEPDSDTDQVVGFDDADSSEDSDGDWSPSDDDDVNLSDDGFAMFEPGKKGAPTTAKAQDLFLRKYFLEYIKSDQFDSALEALDVEHIDLDFLKILQLDPELLNTIQSSEAKAIMNKANLRDLMAATGLVISNWIQIVNFGREIIGELKLELQSGNAQSGSNSTIFRAVRPWTMTDDLAKQ